MMRVIDESSNEQLVTVRLGEKFEIHLAENPTTGYQWMFSLKAEPNCDITSDRFLLASEKSGRSGGEGTRVIGLEAVEEGQSALCLVCRRGWESTDENAPTFRIEILVD